MKTTTTSILTLMLVLSLGLSARAASPAPAQLPDLMDKQQLDNWNAEKTAAAPSSSSAQVATPLFTGKPYVSEAGGYIYHYRTYNPEAVRWTSTDPSGFPDGANNFIYAKDQASYALDDTGLDTHAYTATGNIQVMIGTQYFNLTPSDSGNFSATKNPGAAWTNAGGAWTGNLTGTLSVSSGDVSYTVSTGQPTINYFTQVDPNTQAVTYCVTITSNFLLTKIVTDANGVKTTTVTQQSSTAWTFSTE